MKKFILKWIYRITAINNRKVLLRVANLPANGTVRITKDEEKSVSYTHLTLPTIA